MLEIAKQLLIGVIGNRLSIPLVGVFVLVVVVLSLLGWSGWGRDLRRRRPVETLLVYVAFGALAGAGIWWAHGSQWLEKLMPSSAPPQPSQVSSGAQSPNVIGDHATIVYGVPAPQSESPEKQAYRAALADELNGSGHSLMKSVNRWYTASVGRNRSDADTYWEDSKTRMAASVDLLRVKVNKTAATEFAQNVAAQPPAHMNLIGLPDGAAISDMWHRYNRMTEIERRVRNGTEPIVWPAPHTSQ